jgi:hypothetical protein
MIEVYNIIAKANIGISENEFANPLKILLISPFSIMEIEAELSKKN